MPCEQRIFRLGGALLLLAATAACAAAACGGTSSTSSPGAGIDASFAVDASDQVGDGATPAADGGEDSEADAGAVDAAVRSDADASAHASSDAQCSSTPGAAACGEGGVCALPGHFCCGAPGPGGSVCMAAGAFCGAGGIVEAHCDDTSDCMGGQVCCLARANGPLTGPAWIARCQAPALPPTPPCGSAPSSEHLCACDGDCAAITGSCGPARGEGSRGRTSCTLGL